MAENVLILNKKHVIAVAWAQDINTVGALSRAVDEGFVEALMIGKKAEIQKTCKKKDIDYRKFEIIDIDDETLAAQEAVRLAKNNLADIVMKGLVGTDMFLKAVMDKETGIMIPGAVLSYVCAIGIPSYHKLLFVTDPAVIPFPDLQQKAAMADYAVEMANRFGITRPRIALIGASEKPSRHFRYSDDYPAMIKMVDQGIIRDCIMDGPLDLFLACDKKSIDIKGVNTPVNGEADILLFPSLEACNPFYKALMLFSQGELAGLIRGTEKPVVLMSRSESEKSKYYCIALACLMT